MTNDNRGTYGNLFLRYEHKVPGASSSTYRILHMGYVTKTSMSFNKSTSVTPIVTKTSEQAFPLDGGTSKSYNVNGARIQPSGIDDAAGYDYPTAAVDSGGAAYLLGTVMPAQSLWSCAKWASVMREFADRWQMKTDGCEMLYCPAEGENVYVSIGSYDSARKWSRVHGYISSVEYTYNADFNEQLTYYLQLTVGTAYVNRTENAPAPYTEPAQVPSGESYIYMSSADMSEFYYIGGLDSDEASAVTSYTISGGPDEPFEHIELTLSALSLLRVAPGLIGGSRHKLEINKHLVGGRNVIAVHAVGTASFILNDVQITGRTSNSGIAKTIRLRGVCLANSMMTGKLSSSLSGTPLDIIETILSSGGAGTVFSGGSLVEFPPRGILSQRVTDTIEFQSGDLYWRVLQICAILLRCKIFFAEDKAYLVDYTMDLSASPGTGMQPAQDWKYDDPDHPGPRTIDLYPKKREGQVQQDWMYGRTMSSSIGSQGLVAVYNNVTIKCSDPDGNRLDPPPTYVDPLSDRTLPDSTVVFDIPELVQGQGHTMAQTFAENYMAYMREAQQPISFEVKEGSAGPEWRALFPTVLQADEIVDRSQELSMTNESMLDGSVRFQKLYLSRYVRSYPEMKTEYTWGIVNDTDLPNKLAPGISKD